MKSLYNILLKLLFILFLTTNHLSAANMCYEKPVKTGICLDLLSIGCTTTTTIKNISDSKITDATIVHAFYGLDVGLINGIGIDGSAKTTKKDEDSAEVSGTLSDLTRLGGLVDLNLFGKGIVYRTGNYNKGATHSVYYKNLLSIDISAEAYLATYKIGNKEYSEKLDPCVEFAQGNLRDFTLRNPVNSRNILGDYQVIGNTVLCVKKNGSCYDHTKGSANHDLDLKFIDVDSDKSTYNSSQAKLSIPASAKIKWAAIYAQGHLLIKNKTENKAVTILKDPMKITVPSISGTISSIPKQVDLYTSDAGYTYATYSDIPELVGKKGSEINGWVTVANVKAHEGKESSGLGNFGAWTLVIIYEGDGISLKNISVFDGYKVVKNQTNFKEVSINIDGFITPTSGDVVSRVSIFAGEGDKNIVGDKLYFNNTEIGNTNNAFYSHITSDIERYPSYSNNQGIDIQTYNVGTEGLGLMQNSASSAKIKFTSTQDAYYPSLAIFSTNLYEPRVCYKQEFFDVSGNVIEEVEVGDIITVATWISNMKKDSADTNLETADKVEITLELDSENLEYVAGSTRMKNVYESDFANKTDAQGDDLVDFFFDTNTSKWRVGTGAGSSEGGELIPNVDASDNNKAFIRFQTKLLKDGNISVNNIYKVSYENPQLGLRFGDESPINIGVCTDINSSLGVGILGEFNVVNADGGGGDFNNPSSPQTWLSTQVVNKPFNVKVISLNATGTALKPYSGWVTVSLGSTTQDIYFNGESSKIVSFTHDRAEKNITFEITYGTGKSATSLDNFSIRPNKFEFSTVQDRGLLTSAADYDITLEAYGLSGAPSNGYSTTSAGLTIERTIHNGANGSISFPTPFTITDGIAANAKINFNDVGNVKVEITDMAWAAGDIANGDTPADCNGAFVCGELETTFIPAKFDLTSVTIHNSDDSVFTYLSNNHQDMFASIQATVTAQNALDATTLNFAQGAASNPLEVKFTVPDQGTRVALKNQIADTEDLGFIAGKQTITWNEVDPDKRLFFNFPRTIDTAQNPFVVNGASITLDVESEYTSTFTGAVQDVIGTEVAANSATFIYGRSHAPRQRYEDNNGRAFIYFEAYCFGTDANGVSCDKTLLPNGLNSRSTNDLRWFINPDHNANHGVIGNVVEKNALGRVNPTGQTGVNPVTVDMTYNEDQGYPYKTTMQNNASDWLIYNQDDGVATTNQFPVEFYREDGAWSGAHETDTTTNDHDATNTNRRSMW